MEVRRAEKPNPVSGNVMLIAGLALVSLAIVYRVFIRSDLDGSFDVANGLFTINKSSGRVGVNTSSPTSTFEVSGTTKTTGLNVSSQLQVPVDSTPVGATEGAIQYSTGSNSLQVYKDGTGWEDVGGGAIPIAIPIAETNEDLVQGADDPLIVSFLEGLFTTTVTVNSEATFNSATAAAAENTRIQLTSDITCASNLSIPNKSLWIDLNGFTLSVPVSAASGIACLQSTKNIYFSNGTIQYNASGTTGSSSTMISASNCFLYIRNVTIIHAEYAVIVSGSGGNRLTFYTSGSTYTMNKARSSNNNSYGPIGMFGMVTTDSYIYITGCTFNTLAGDTFLNTATDRYNMRGVVRSSGIHLSGSCTITGCTINPAHRMQAVFYSDNFSTTGARGTFRLMIDKNTIGDAGVREQLVLLFGSYKVLNCFESIWLLENTYERIDSNKGMMYLDSGSAAGSTDVYIFKNTLPAQKPVDPISFAATYSRDGSGIATITTPTPHNFTVGYDITTVSSTGGLTNGPFIIQSIVSSTQFTIADPVVGVASGTVTVGDNYATSLRKNISKDELVRGPTTITSAYLQKYYF